MEVRLLSAKMEAEDIRKSIWKHQAEDSCDIYIDFLLE